MTDAAIPTRERRPREETTRFGREIYERDTRAQVESGHHAEYIAIDVDSGAWAMSDDALSAADGLRAQHPEAVDVFLLRVRHRALHHFGAGPCGGRSNRASALAAARTTRARGLLGA